MPQLLADKLEKYIANMGASNPEARIVPLSRTVLGREFKRGIRRSGVKDIHIHCLRHSYTALIASLGASPVEAAERLGHENVKTTLNIYSHAMDSSKKVSDKSFLLILISTSDKSGTLYITQISLHNKDAAISFNTEFLAPLMVTSPFVGF